MGHSAGAYNAAMLALDPRWLAQAGMTPAQLAGWIGLAGPYDFFPATNPDVRPVFNHPDYPKGAQPIEHAANRSSRVLLGAAARDSVVNPGAQHRRAMDQPPRELRTIHETTFGACAGSADFSASWNTLAAASLSPALRM